MRSFVHDQPGIRIVFATGALSRLAEEVQRLGCARALILTSSRRRADADEASKILGAASIGVFAEAEMHVPAAAARGAVDAAKTSKADCCVAVGGGSTIGLGKVIARDTGLPAIAVPTTYSGSEMTAVYGITEGGVKRTGRDIKVLAKTVIYDPALTLKLPAKVAGPSGMNALAHCMAGILDNELSPAVRLLADEGVRVLFDALPRVVTDPAVLNARADALYGAWLAGSVLSAARANVHYKICHALGGAFNLPHAEVHAIVLPYSIAYNTDSARQGQEIYDLGRRVGAPAALKDIGMPEEGLDRAARLATENVAFNPRPVDFISVRKLLEEAYEGKRPE